MNLCFRQHAEKWRSCCLIFVIFSVVNVSCFKLTSPRILLGYNLGLPTNYTLHITGTKPADCFHWYSSNPQIIQIVPIFNPASANCSQAAVVSSVANLLERKVTRVAAVHQGKIGIELFCDVFTNTVNSIELEWITDELVLGGVPEKIIVKAKDKAGREFSSINGLQIQWKITHSPKESTDSPEKEVARLMGFSYSNYQSHDDNLEWERRGMLGPVILVEAVSLGTCSVSASLMQSASPLLFTDEVSLRVIPNLKFGPSTSVYLLNHASAQIYLEEIKGGKFSEADLNDFDVQVADPSVIKLENSSKITSLEYGSSQVTIRSINSNNYPDMQANFHVVKPAYIKFRISRGGFKTLEEMKSYEVHVDLYDEKHNKIYPSDNLRLMVSFPTRLFHVNFTTSNGTYFIVQATAPGSGTIRAEFKGVILQDSTLHKEDKMTGAEVVTVIQKLHIFPPRMLLPFYSSSTPLHEIDLKVAGGTGQYVWASSNNTAATISFDEEKGNIARIRIYDEADLLFTSTDKNNINLVSSAKISVQPVADIETFPTVVEAEVGNTLILPTAFLGYESKEKNIQRKFDDCSKLEPSVEVVEKHVLTYDREAHIPAFGKGCFSLQFRCKYPGYTRVNILYKTGASDSNDTAHKTTTVLACYKSLKPVHPVRVAVLPLGTSKEVAFEGGPRKWPLYKEGHYTELEASDPGVLKIELIKDPVRYNKDLTVFRVLCKELGENTLTFRIGNHPSATNRHPAKSEASIKFICNEPHSLHLKLHQKQNAKKLLDESIVKVPFYGNKQFDVDVWVKDEKGRKFANISSLSIQWDVPDKSLAQPESYSGFMTHENAVAGYRKVSRDFKEFKMTGASGSLNVEAKILGYREDVLLKANVSDFKRIQEISTSVNLKLVSLRDINAGLYASNQEKEEEGYCDGDSCES